MFIDKIERKALSAALFMG